VRHVARENDPLAFRIGIHDRHRRDQRLGVGMAKQSTNLDKKSDYFAFERIYFRHRAMVFAWVRGSNGFGRQLGSKWRHGKSYGGLDNLFNHN